MVLASLDPAQEEPAVKSTLAGQMFSSEQVYRDPEGCTVLKGGETARMNVGKDEGMNECRNEGRNDGRNECMKE